tara:strand:- start:217 stop:681 length:465 start_codon:yes stop_codon:yes gene_type:complete
MANIYQMYMDRAGDRAEDPSTHAYRFTNYIRPYSPSSDMYHQYAAYDMLKGMTEGLPGPLQKPAAGIAALGMQLASPFYDLGSGYLDFLTANKQTGQRQDLMPFLAGQNPLPQMKNRGIGSLQFIFGPSNQFLEGYNKLFENRPATQGASMRND